MPTDWGKSERVRGGKQVHLVRLDPLRTAIVFNFPTIEDADVFMDRTLKGLKRGEFKMRLRGIPTSIEES